LSAGSGSGSWRRRGRCWLLALVPPLLLGAYSQLPLALPLLWVALVPWIVLYTDDRRPRVSYGYFVVAAALSQPLLYPVIFRFGASFPIAFSLTFMVPWLAFPLLMRRVHHAFRLPRSLTFPLVWVTVEWLRATLSLAHFDVFRLGTAHAPVTPLIQFADVTGVYGVSFLIAAINGWLADLWFSLREHGWRHRAGWLSRRVVVGAGCLALAVVAALGYGFLRLSGTRWSEGPRLAVVQPNIRHLGTNAVGVHLGQLLMTDEKIPAGAADLIVWPENAILDNLRRPGAYLDDLQWLAQQKSARFLVGAMGKSASHPGRTTNGAFLVDEDGTVLGEYDKQVLFPWSEYVPLDGVLGRFAGGMQALQRMLVRRGWGFMPTGVPGEGMRLLELPWNGETVPFAALICVENTYPPIPADAGRRGARFFVNITSEGEVGGPLQEHLLRTSMMRAVENRIAYVRAGNSGVSGFIDPLGRLQRLLIGERGGTIFDAGVLIDRVALTASGPTLYSRSRDAFAKLCIAASVGLFLWSWVGGSRRGAAGIALLLVTLGATGCMGPPELGEDPSQARDAVDRGLGLFQQGRLADALPEFARACADPLACRRVLGFAADSFRGTQRPEVGIGFFDAVAERHPDLTADALAYKAGLLIDALRLLEAERTYRQALQTTPLPWVYGELGSLLLRLDRWDEAIDTYRQGVALSPTDVDLRFRLGRSLRMTAQWDEAQAVLQSVLNDDPSHGQAWTNLGRVYLGRGEIESGENALRRAITLEPTNIEARYQLVKLALRSGEREEARRLLDEIQRIEAGRGRGQHGSN
jgi:apolipoprotein N-acyltransferase